MDHNDNINVVLWNRFQSSWNGRVILHLDFPGSSRIVLKPCVCCQDERSRNTSLEHAENGQSFAKCTTHILYFLFHAAHSQATCRNSRINIPCFMPLNSNTHYTSSLIYPILSSPYTCQNAMLVFYCLHAYAHTLY